MIFCLWADATDVQFTLTDPQFGISQTTNRTVIVQAESGTAVNGNNVILPFRLAFTTDINGVCTASNLYGSAIGGYYHITIPSPPQRADFDIWVQSTNLGLVQASTILGVFGASTYPAQVFAWGAGVSDARYAMNTNQTGSYAQIGQLLSVSNSLFIYFTNLNTVTSNGIVSQIPTNTITPAMATNITQGVYSNNPSGYTTSNSVAQNYYPTSNPSFFVTQAQLNGTNTINLQATTNLVNASTNGLVTAAQAALFYYPTSNPSGFISASGTSGLATVQFVTNLNTITSNGIVAQITSGSVNAATATNIANGVYSNNPSSYSTLPQVTNIVQSLANTNQFTLQTVTNIANSVYSNNPSNYATTILVQAFGLNLTNLISLLGTEATNNDLVTSNGAVASAANLAKQATNGLPSSVWSLGTISSRGSNEFYLNSNPSNYQSGAQMLSSSNSVLTNANSFSLLIGANDTNNVIGTSNSIVSLVGGNFVKSTNGVITSAKIETTLQFNNWTNFNLTTNLIGSFGSSVPACSSTWEKFSSTMWTNVFFTNWNIQLSGGNYYMQSNGVSFFANTGLEGSWTVVVPFGSAPAPYSAFGSYWNMNGTKFVGYVYSTNLMAQMINAVNTYGISSNEVVTLILANSSNPTNGVSATFVTNCILSFNYATISNLNTSILTLSNEFAGISGVTLVQVTNAATSVATGIANNVQLGGYLIGAPTNALFNSVGLNVITNIAANLSGKPYSGTNDPNGLVVAPFGSFYNQFDVNSNFLYSLVNTNGLSGWQE